MNNDSNATRPSKLHKERFRGSMWPFTDKGRKKNPQGNESLDWQKEMCKDRSEKEKLLMNVFSST